MVHYDLNLHNIAVVDGRFPKLNDFNVAMFLSWDRKKEATCGFEGRFIEPWFRSPEEMQNQIEDGTDDVPLTEKVDVYSLGNILWSLLMNKPPWKRDEKKMDEIRQRVARGEIPTLPSNIANSTDPTIVAIRDAMFKCLRINPEERASAGEVAHDLKMVLKEVKRLEKEEKKRKKELAEKAAKLAKELEKRKKEAEEIAAKTIEEGAIMEPEILAGQELMAQAEQQVNDEGRDGTATETKPMEVANE
jgi:serine/threonine protein kinase